MAKLSFQWHLPVYSFQWSQDIVKGGGASVVGLVEISMLGNHIRWKMSPTKLKCVALNYILNFCIKFVGKLF
jgi:hypothetical protein